MFSHAPNVLVFPHWHQPAVSTHHQNYMCHKPYPLDRNSWTGWNELKDKKYWNRTWRKQQSCNYQPRPRHSRRKSSSWQWRSCTTCGDASRSWRSLRAYPPSTPQATGRQRAGSTLSSVQKCHELTLASAKRPSVKYGIKHWGASPILFWSSLFQIQF